jgi:hypothetical protein
MSQSQISVKLGLDKSSFEAGLNGIKGSFNALKTAFAGIGISFGIQKIVQFGQAVIDMADEIKDVSDNIGISTTFLQQFQRVVSMSGGSVEDATKALEKLSVKMGEAVSGNATALQAFTDLGISLVDANGNLKSVEQIMMELSDVMMRAPSDIDRSRIAIDLMSKTGIHLVGTLKDGSEALQDLMSVQNVMGEQTIQMLSAIKDMWVQIKGEITTLAGEVMYDLIMSITAHIAVYSSLSKKDMWASIWNRKSFDENFTQKLALVRVLLEEAMKPKSGVSVPFKQITTASKDVERSLERIIDLRRKNELALMSEEDKLKSLQKERESVLASTPSLENTEKALKLESDIITQKSVVERERLANIEKENALIEKQKGLLNAMRNRSGSTIDDLANMDPRNRNQRRVKEMAQEVQRLEREAKNFAAEGNQKEADRYTREALRGRAMIPGLTSSEANPLGLKDGQPAPGTPEPKPKRPLTKLEEEWQKNADKIRGGWKNEADKINLGRQIQNENIQRQRMGLGPIKNIKEAGATIQDLYNAMVKEGILVKPVMRGKG